MAKIPEFKSKEEAGEFCEEVLDKILEGPEAIACPTAFFVEVVDDERFRSSQGVGVLAVTKSQLLVYDRDLHLVWVPVEKCLMHLG